MSYKRHHTDVSTGGAGNQMQSARRPSTQTTIFKRETFDDSLPEESKSQRTPSDGAESDASSDRPGRARKKAEPVKSACVQCQKRKTKCSGQRPVCRFCSDRNLECSWDIGDGLTRTADLKQKLHEANLKSEDLSDLVSAMRTGTDQTSSMLLARLRLGCSMEELLSNIRHDESSGESRQGSMDQQMMASGQNVPLATGATYPSPASPEHQFEWHGPGPQFHHTQPTDSWMTDANAQYYQPNNQQQPFFTTPNYNRPQTMWPRHDSFYPVENNNQNDAKAQGFNTAPNQNARLPPGVTMVPRKSNDTFPTQSALARNGRGADTRNDMKNVIQLSASPPTDHDVRPNAALPPSCNTGNHPQSVHYCNEQTSNPATCPHS